MPEKTRKLLMLLGLGLCLAMLMGEFKVEKKQKICHEFIPNRVGRVAKSFVQLSETKEIQRVGEIHSSTVVCLAKIYFTNYLL